MEKTISIKIKLPMEFPDDWSDDDIEFSLNESSWCASSIIPLLEKYDKEHGCLCNICEFAVLPSDGKENK